MRTPRLLPLAAVIALAAAAPASAHEVDVDTIASGLDNPRHVAVSEWGSVYVAEAGKGASNPATATSCFNSAEGPACTGATGAITKIDRHGQRRVVRGLASFAVAELNPEMPDVDIGDNAIGPHGVYVKGHRRLLHERRPDRAVPRRSAPMRRTSRATRRWSTRTRSRRATASCSSCAAPAACARSPTCGRSRTRTTRTPEEATRSSTAIPSTCSPIAGASSSPTPAATRCCGRAAAGTSRSSACSRTFSSRTRSSPETFR